MSTNETTELTAAEEAAAEIIWHQLDGEDYDPEDGGHARALLDHRELAAEFVAKLTPIIKAQALAEVRKNQLGMARRFAHDAEVQHQRFADAGLDTAGIEARAQGAAWGAVAQLQMLLMELGEVEFDEAAECTWDIVQNRAGGSR